MFDVDVEIFEYALILWLGILGLCVARDVLLRGGMIGILRGPNGSASDPERLLLLYFTVGFALYYTLTTFSLDELPIVDGRKSMPDISNEILIALFGAQGTYVIGKILRTLKGI